MFNYNGPMLWMGYLFCDSGTSASQIVSAIDSVINPIRENGVMKTELERAHVKLRSDLYDSIDSGFGRADMLASFALFDDRPDMINEIETKFAAVTPALVQKTAVDYLRSSNRTILQIAPAQAGASAQKGVN
jgi:predicted Zn-dependent peptidase